jgi:iron complex transport system permease protein
MKRSKHLRYAAGFTVLLILAAVLFAVNIVMGSSSISLGEAADILFGSAADTPAKKIITDIRLPRTIAALLLGGALSVSGFLLQCFFDNPIAGPYVLGISSGAKLAVAAVMIASPFRKTLFIQH